MATWKDQKLNEAKEILAYELTSMVHGQEEAAKAQMRPAPCSAALPTPEHMPTTTLTEADLTDGSIGILTLMVKAGSGRLQRRGPPPRHPGRRPGQRREGGRPHRQLHRRPAGRRHRHQEGQKGLSQGDDVTP